MQGAVLVHGLATDASATDTDVTAQLQYFALLYANLGASLQGIGAQSERVEAAFRNALTIDPVRTPLCCIVHFDGCVRRAITASTTTLAIFSRTVVGCWKQSSATLRPFDWNRHWLWRGTTWHACCWTKATLQRHCATFCRHCC